MNKIKIDWQKIGSIALSAAQSSAAPILTGIGMMGLAVLCKKLNIPYQVLFDPSYTMSTKKVSNFAPTTQTSPFLFMPGNSTEAAISAIVDSMDSSDADYYICQSAEKIYGMLSDNPGPIPDQTKTHAIMAINNLSKMMYSSYYKKRASELIAKIGVGDY